MNDCTIVRNQRGQPKRSGPDALTQIVNYIRVRVVGNLRSSAPLTLVTGADESHALPLRRFLRSVLEHEPGTETIVYDLGLKQKDRALISRHFNLRTFDFAAHPDHCDIKVNAGQYAWKPAILHQVASERSGNLVCWMDAGNIITEPLKELRWALALNGFYSPIGFWYFGDWVHPGMLRYFGLPTDWRHFKWTLAACVVAVDTRCPKAVELISQWALHAGVRDCIAPVGSDRSNHRQDQALISLLAYRNGFVPSFPPSQLGFVAHQDESTHWATI